MKKYSFIFIGQIVPQKLLNDNFEDLKEIVDIAGNTFYTALLEGLAENGCSVSAESRINIKNAKKREKYNGVDYKFLSYIKINILRFLTMAFGNIVRVIKFKVRKKGDKTNQYAIFNVLRISSSIGAIFVCKLLKIPTIGVVTDVPGYRIKRKKRKFITFFADRLGQILLNHFDMYVLLSEAMRDVIKLKNKEYTIIEGIYDTLIEPETSFSEKNIADIKFKIMYAGSLHYKYGIMNLVKAVQNLPFQDIELDIFGSGEAEYEIAEISKKDNRISWGGLIPRNKLLEYERQASLLINPRPVEDEYVKYSFPSKNIEYMASGTPVLLTNIPSLPDSYKKYVVLVETNEIALLSEKIIEVYRNQKKYADLGKHARKYICEEKNKIKQSQKILKMIIH